MYDLYDYSPREFLIWLEGKITRINEIEALGREAVAKNEQDAYIALMREKAGILAALNDEAQPYLDEIDDEDALDFAERGIAVYSYNANKAIEIDSVFYMSALLFPEGHKTGEPHNLEIFRDELKKRLGL